MEHGSRGMCLNNSSKSLPDCYTVLVRQTVRDIFLEKGKVPTLDSIFQRLTSLTFAEVEHLHLRTEEDFPHLDRTVWTRSRKLYIVT